MVDMFDAVSSNVLRYGYDKDKQVFYVVWRSRPDMASSYQGVPTEVATSVISAPSTGIAVRQHLIPDYTHEYQPLSVLES